MIYLGIDPGLSGGIAAIDHNSNILLLEAVPVMAGLKANTRMVDGLAMRALLIARQITPLHAAVFAAIERVNAMPKQGVTSSFKFGESYGILQGVLCGLNIGHEFILPQAWKKYYGLSSDKAQSLAEVSRRYPGLKLKKSDDGMAEALLIATYLKSAR